MKIKLEFDVDDIVRDGDGVSIDELVRERIVSSMQERVMERMNHRIDSALEKHARQAIAEAVRRAAEAFAKAELEKTLSVQVEVIRNEIRKAVSDAAASNLRKMLSNL